jgi:hypothetical protein
MVINYLSTDLVPAVKGPNMIVVKDLGTTPILVLMGNVSSDPVKLAFSYSWTCPDYLGGASC